MRAAQTDVVSLAVARLQPLMIAAAQAGGSVEPAVLDQLTIWDAAMHADRPEPLIFTAWLREAVKAIYGDDLGEAFNRYFDYRALALDPPARRPRHRARLVRRPRHARAARAAGRCWPAPSTRRCTGCRRATAPTGRSGAGDARTTPSSEHRAFGSVPTLARFFNVEVASGGGNYTLNRGKAEFGEDPPFANKHAASFRAIYDLPTSTARCFIDHGPVGNPLSPFYRSFAGAGRRCVHRDRHPARRPRQGEARHVAAHAK